MKKLVENPTSSIKFVAGVSLLPGEQRYINVLPDGLPPAPVPIARDPVTGKFFAGPDEINLSSVSGGRNFYPNMPTFEAALAAAQAARDAGGGTVRYAGIPYFFGNNKMPAYSGVSHVGVRAILSTVGGAPDINTTLIGGTIIDCQAPYAFAGNDVEGAIFTGSLNSAGVLTVTAVSVNPLTGNTGTIQTRGIVRSPGNIPATDSPSIDPGQTSGAPIVISQLTGTPGGVGTYQTNRVGLTVGSVSMYVWNTPRYLSGVHYENLAVQGGASAIQLGAFNAPGCAFSEIKNIYCFGATSGRGVDLLNFEHIKASRLFNFNCANAQRMGSYASNPDGGIGNSLVEHIYNYASGNPFAKGIELGAGENQPGYSGCPITVNFIQNNHYNRTQYVDSAVSITSGSANVNVTNGTNFPVGMLCRFISSNPGGFPGGANPDGTNDTAQVTLFVLTRTGNVITLGYSPDGPAIVATATLSNLSLSRYGFPHIVFRGGVGQGIPGGAVMGVDAEGDGAVVLVHRATMEVIGSGIDRMHGEHWCIRNSANVVLRLSGACYIDAAGGTNNGIWVHNNTPLLCGSLSGGDRLKGLFPRNGKTGLNIATNLGASGDGSFVNESPGNQDWTRPGIPLGVCNAWSSIYSPATSVTINQGQGGYLPYTGTGDGVWTWAPGKNASMACYEQTFLNKGTGTLTITLGGSDGTFGGMTGGTSSGKSMRLAQGTATTLPGSLTIVCAQIGANSYEWQVKSMVNATLV